MRFVWRKHVWLGWAACIVACSWRQGCGKTVGKMKINPKVAALHTPSELQQFVTKEKGTEPAFNNLYWNHHEPGIYVDVSTGAALFSSQDKFDSNTGWPSFTRSIAPDALQYQPDDSYGMQRTEVLAVASNNHLGHVFNDGPNGAPRFCINSAALHFVPLAQMREQGYEAYLFDFAASQHWQTATFAGGCFWGMEAQFAHEKGVLATQVGYAGDRLASPNYQMVATGNTRFAESIQVLFDPEQTSYEALVKHFFKVHDPTTPDRQGNDIGPQYRSIVFTTNKAQAEVARRIIQQAAKLPFFAGRTIVTHIEPLQQFWRAESQHQQYLEHHPEGYTCHYPRNINFE